MRHPAIETRGSSTTVGFFVGPAKFPQIASYSGFLRGVTALQLTFRRGSCADPVPRDKDAVYWWISETAEELRRRAQ